MAGAKTKQLLLHNYKIFILCLLSLQGFHSIAQTKYLDSLRSNISFAKNNPEKLSAIFKLFQQANSINPDTLTKYYILANTIALQSGSKDDQLQANLYKADILRRKGRFEVAKTLIDSSLALLKNSNNVSLKMQFLILQSNLLIRLNRQKEAMDISLQLLSIAEKVKNVPVQVRAKITIGWAYMELAQNRNALNWFFAAEKQQKTLPKNQWQPFLYSNIAAVYNELKKNDSAEYYIQKSLAEATASHDLSYLANTYFIYGGIMSDEGKTAIAESLLQKGTATREIIGDPFYIVSDMYQMGLFYANIKQPQKGIAELRKGISMAYQNDLPEKLPILYTALAKNYKLAGNYMQYGAVMDTLVLLKDSLYKKNSADALAELQTKYELQKKENTIIQQHYDLAKKDLFIYIACGLLILSILTGYFLLQNRKKNQQLKLQELEMNQKRKLTHSIINAEEHERKRIAKDLHDSVAQKMVVAKLNLEAFANGLTMEDQKQKIFSNIGTLLKDSADEVRSLSHSMMPHLLERNGLSNSIKDFLDKIHKKDFKINFNAEGDFSAFRENRAFLIYRIIQECVQNVLKHAAASRLDVSLICMNDELDLMIEDNGNGFDIKTVQDGIGLKNIRSRVEFLNGKLDINSSPGRGTVIAIYIPL